MGVVVHIDRFSGPLALLLHLIRQEEMDIFDINIHEITRQYLESIKTMKKMNLEVAGDFIAMAATLIQIKSRMLLPQYNDEGEVIEEADPRRDLVRRLMEYQAYQDAGQNLYKRPLLGRDVWSRGRREELARDGYLEYDDAIAVDDDNALYSLIAVYRSVVKKMKKTVHRVGESLQSIADRVRELSHCLRVGEPATLSSLVGVGASGDGSLTVERTLDRLLITFLSLLELAKMGFVQLFQSENFSDVHIDTKTSIDAVAISQVESYDSQAATVNASAEIWLNDTDREEVREDNSTVAHAAPVAATDAEIDAAEAETRNLDQEQGA